MARIGLFCTLVLLTISSLACEDNTVPDAWVGVEIVDAWTYAAWGEVVLIHPEYDWWHELWQGQTLRCDVPPGEYEIIYCPSSLGWSCASARFGSSTRA